MQPLPELRRGTESILRRIPHVIAAMSGHSAGLCQAGWNREMSHCHPTPDLSQGWDFFLPP